MIDGGPELATVLEGDAAVFLESDQAVVLLVRRHMLAPEGVSVFLEAEAGQTLAVQLLLEVRRALLWHKSTLPSNSKMVKYMPPERGRHIPDLNATRRTLITLPQIKLNWLEDLRP